MLAGPISAIAIGYLLSENRAGLLLRMAICDGVATWSVGLPLLAAFGVIGIGVGQVASGLVDLVFLTVAVWHGSSRRGFGFTLVPLAAVVTASVPAWMIATALGKAVVALLASVAVGELIYAAIVMVCRRPIVLDAVRLGRRTVRASAIDDLSSARRHQRPDPDLRCSQQAHGPRRGRPESGVRPQQIVLIHNPDGSPDGARPWAPPDASTLIMPRNVGYGHAMNTGMRFAAERGAEWLLLLTHDVQFADSALTTLLAAREHGDGFAVLGPALRRADNGSVYSFGGVEDAKTLVRHVTEEPVNPVDGIAECLWLDGCAMLVRSAPVIAAGLMRGDFFMYFDEPEICLRIRRLGWK